MSQPQRSASPSEIPQTAPLHALPTPPPARPEAVDPEAARLICEYIRYDGLADHLAAALLRVSRARLERWKAEDEEFALDLASARALFELDLLRRIRDARKSNGAPEWRAQVWLLQNASAEGVMKPVRGGTRAAKAGDAAPPKRAILPETPPAPAKVAAPAPTEWCAPAPGPLAARENSAILPETPRPASATASSGSR